MAYTWIITTSSGLLLLLRFLHIISTFLWLGLIFKKLDPLTSKITVSSQVLPLVLSLLSFFTGVILFWMTPSTLHTSWGYSTSIGFGISLLMLANQIKSYVFLIDSAALNLTLAVPALFLMSMSSSAGIQISPTSNFALVVSVSLMPTLAVWCLGLMPKYRSFFNRPSVFLSASVLMVIVTYLLLEIFSKLK